jgi:hypothetical protein
MVCGAPLQLDADIFIILTNSRDIRDSRQKIPDVHWCNDKDRQSWAESQTNIRCWSIMNQLSHFFDAIWDRLGYLEQIIANLFHSTANHCNKQISNCVRANQWNDERFCLLLISCLNVASNLANLLWASCNNPDILYSLIAIKSLRVCANPASYN